MVAHKTMFWMYYRAGSMMALHLLGSNSLWKNSSLEVYRKSEENTWWLPAAPFTGFARHIHSGGIEEAIHKADYILARGHQPASFVCTSRIGNWWGEKSADFVPLPYEDPSPMKWSYMEMQKLDVDSHLLLIRDGRNQIESTRRLKGGIEEKWQTKDPEDYFVALCKGFRNRARLALDSQQVMGNLSIIRFEDVLSDPVSVISNIVESFQLQPDVEFITALWEQLEQRRVCKQHSSFQDNNRMNQRWHSWTPREVQIFAEIAGKELEELGYTWER
jgi:hypothetical protein